MSTPLGDCTHHAQVMRLRRVARKALAAFDLEAARFTLLNHGENTTFRVHSSAGEFNLRLHRPAYNTTAAIEGELRWLDALSDASFGLQAPCRTASGDGVVHAVDGNVERRATMLPYVRGRLAGRTLAPGYFRRVGELVARLHQHSQNWGQTACRPPKTVEDMLGLPGTRFAPLTCAAEGDELRLLLEAQQTVLARCDGSAGTPLLVHGDLHGGNIVQAHGRLVPIDFDDASISPPATDAAVALSSAYALTADPTPQREAFLEGYAAVTSLPFAVERIEDLLMARRLEMLVWMAQRLDLPRFRLRLPKRRERTIDHARSYLAARS